MPFASLPSNDTIFYLDENPNGEPAIMLLHGLGANSDSWIAQIPALVQPGFRVIVPDAPGFGRSPNPHTKTQAKQIAKALSTLLDQLDIACAILVGISMGGTHALQFALDYPEKTKKLVLVNTFARLRIANPAQLPYFAWRVLLVHTLGLERQAKTVAKRIFPKPNQDFLRQGLITQVLQADPKTYRAAMRSLGRFNVTHRLSEISAPTLVITGEEDTTVPTTDQAVLVQKIANARQVIIPGAGHAVSVEQPQVFNKALLDFLHTPS